MKLIVEQSDGTKLTFDGDARELTIIAEKFASRQLAESSTLFTSRPPTPLPETWTDSNLRELWALLWGEQARLVKFLVERSGEAPYTDIGVYMGYERQRLGAILSAIIRNARKAAKDPEAQFLRWRVSVSDNRGQIIYIDPSALDTMERIIQSDPSH
jgi:hypothetical protein